MISNDPIRDRSVIFLHSIYGRLGLGLAAASDQLAYAEAQGSRAKHVGLRWLRGRGTGGCPRTADLAVDPLS